VLKKYKISKTKLSSPSIDPLELVELGVAQVEV
jgi:hypothetical protein